MIETIDQAIRKIWTSDLKRDYNEGWLWREDSLKNAFYFHLRKTLGETFFTSNDLRIVTELNLQDYYYRVDLAIVRVGDEYEIDHTEPLALVEFKFKAASCPYEVIASDVKKFHQLCSDSNFQDTKFYLAIIHEDYYTADDTISWLDGRQWRWARNRLTELSGFWNAESDLLNMVVIDGLE